MERLQGPINPCLFGEEHLDLESLEQEKIPFLEMLQTGGLESPAFSPFGCDLSFQALLSFQQYCKKPPWDHHHYTPELMGCSGGRFTAAEQPDSCLTTTHDVLEMELSQVRSETKITHSICDGESSGFCCGEGVNGPSGAIVSGTVGRERESGLNVSPAAANKEKKKRVKRTRPSEKNKEEVESQRMTHIAVERNRRRQMNDHLAALRSLMPSSYIQRGDQASIIGGAIDYVKELEQLLQSLQSRKRMRKSEPSGDAGGGSGGDTTSSSTSSSSAATDGMLAASSLTSSQCRNIKAELGEPGHCSTEEGINIRRGYEFTAEKKTEAAEVRVTVIQNHVNLKVECPRRAGQLLDAIVAFEDLGLTVLHLNITSLEASVHYSFNLKIEEGCELGSAEGIAMAVHQIFSFINGSA